jgi:uncharacterized RDD family membrane protein YckC
MRRPPEIQALVRVRLWRRLAAAAYDLLLVIALFMVLTALVIAARGGRSIDSGSLWFQFLLLTGWWLYFGWSWTHGGQTVGMRAWRLVVLTEDGGPVGWGRSVLRFAAAGLSALAAGLGFLWSLVDRNGLTWHDRLSRTVLRHRPQSAQP